MTWIAKVLPLLLLGVLFVGDAQARQGQQGQVRQNKRAEAGQEQQGQDRQEEQDDTLMVLPDTLAVDTVMVDTLQLDTIEDLHPLIWEHVHQDEKIAWLLQAHRHAVSRQPGIAGYRVHLYMDSGNRARLNTQHEKADFLEKYPDVNAYIVYEEPYFKLRAGDFRTRVDARRFLEEIRGDYSAAYIVVDRINFPELD